MDGKWFRFGRRAGIAPRRWRYWRSAAAGCGDDDEDTTTSSEDSTGELSAIKDYLTDHSAALAEQATTGCASWRRSTTTWPSSPTSTTTRCWPRTATEVAARSSTSPRPRIAEANPSYEEMEGIVAGVPRLAQYDVDIDAGADASDPENAVSFSLELPNGETLKQPGNLFFVTETALYGTNPDFLAKGVKGDVDGDGQVEFGEGLPDADIYLAATEEFESQAKNLDADAQEFEPTPSDAFTAITVMTPTMSEYFEAWKNSRFVAGEGRDRAGLRRRLAPVGHRRHPRGAGPHLRPGRAADRGREPAAGRADQEGAGRPARLRRGPARPGGRGQEVHRRGGRHARRRGAAPGRGDRRPGDPGRPAAQHRAPGGLARRPWDDSPHHIPRLAPLQGGRRGSHSRGGRPVSASRRRPGRGALAAGDDGPGQAVRGADGHPARGRRQRRGRRGRGRGRGHRQAGEAARGLLARRCCASSAPRSRPASPRRRRATRWPWPRRAGGRWRRSATAPSTSPSRRPRRARSSGRATGC